MLRADHVAIPVWNAAASLEFYSEVLGLPLISASTGDDWGGKDWLLMGFALADQRELVLVALRGAEAPPADGGPADARHYALGAQDAAALDAWRAKLTKAGVGFTEADHGDRQSIYFQDPNGVMLEITAPPTRAEGPADPAALAKARGWIAAA
jgi:catechol 2,3-dioxygenase-like lactoylglutathione lyase family enzyme